MKATKILIFIFILALSGCRKISLDKSKEQIIGKWELQTYEINGKDEMASFKNDPFFADYFICYPYNDTNLVVNTKSKNYSVGKWNIETPETSNYRYNDIKLYLIFTPYLFNGSPQNYNGSYGFYNFWFVTKLNNNKLIISIALFYYIVL